jgi:hypothetical protein
MKHAFSVQYSTSLLNLSVLESTKSKGLLGLVIPLLEKYWANFATPHMPHLHCAIYKRESTSNIENLVAITDEHTKIFAQWIHILNCLIT